MIYKGGDNITDILPFIILGIIELFIFWLWDLSNRD